jgi:hypothetical protein
MSTDSSFDALGIPFPLFEAPVSEASGFEPAGQCSLCPAQGPVFTLGIGHDLIRSCPRCGQDTALEVSDRKAAPCVHCKAPVPFPQLPGEPLRACHGCVRAGRVAFTQDTELGMVNWQCAREGLTHGVPGLRHPDFELVPLPVEEGFEDEGQWMRARVDSLHLLELVRTPSYKTWQGERWLFCCQRPMRFLGRWTKKDFTAQAQAGLEVTPRSALGKEARFALDEGHSAPMFRCTVCSRLLGHADRS